MCCEGCPVCVSAPWKHATVNPKISDVYCEPKDYPIIFGNPNLTPNPTIIMTSCHHNAFIGLKNRYLKEAAPSLTYNYNIVESILDKLCQELKPYYDGPITLQQFLSKKKGKLAGRYDNACRKILKDNHFDIYKDNKMQAFIKNEIYSEEGKPPRMIMGRDPKFNLIYGLFTTSLEHAMINLPQISKGKNFIDRGKQFHDLIFGDLILEGDCSKFEGSQRLELLRQIELGIWKRLESTPNYKLLENIFSSKMRKQGFTNHGVYFDFWYCRGSGDMDTGLFNTLLMYVACRYFEIINNFGNGNFICDGDDNLIKIPIGCRNFQNTFKEFGFDAKLILRNDYHDANYCSGKFIQYSNNKFIYIQDVIKLMNNLPIFKKSNFINCKADYYHSLGYMYKIIYQQIPLFNNISNFLLRNTPNYHVKTEILNDINPSHCEAFKNSTYLLDLDLNVCNVEICMCFNIGMGQLDTYCDWYDRSIISFEKTECKKYNNSKTPRVRLSEVEIEQVYQLLVTGIKSPSGLYLKRYNSDR